MKHLAIAVAAALLTGPGVHAQEKLPEHNWTQPPMKPGSSEGRINYYSGNMLYDLCQKNEFACTTYIQGVNDGMFGMNIGTSRDLSYCIPAGSTAKQVHDVVIQFLTAHPELRDKMASLLVANALSNAWPQCP